MPEVYVISKNVANSYFHAEAVDVTKNTGAFRYLSPFVLKPKHEALNLENLWQFSKVYPEHADVLGSPTQEYFDWRSRGWADPQAHRYPMGKGRKPLYSLWFGEKLGYIEARKKIYATMYAEAVIDTVSYKVLEVIYNHGVDLVLIDYDGYDYIREGVSLKRVINNPHKIMGHAFVLAMLLKGELEECLKD